MRKTCHSETGILRDVYIKKASDAFGSDDHLEKNWKSLNYLGKPSFPGSLAEYEAFESILKNHVENIYYFPIDSGVNMDSIYCRDASLATNGGMILCNMGKAARRGEPAAQRKAFLRDGVPLLGEIQVPGTLEGGDVAWLGENTLAVGHSYRSNEEGISQLTALLAPQGVEVIPVPLPHYRGPSDVFHLMSILSPVDSNLAVVYSPLMPISFRNLLLARGYQLVEVPEEEFESLGCNVLALSPRVCLMVEGNPKTKSLLEKEGCLVLTYRGQEISVKGGGGPTCLTRPFSRVI